ncbi:M48 family metallopeptidase [Treponema sp. C6A8]|uniref:tetratricopeptide repeat protein n=1 Tax=Treponema sp. C6A8 TaxID=1410609 RepID=UPI0012DDFAD7|nr:hypothetical protein [Treponema sp. C6A8]
MAKKFSIEEQDTVYFNDLLKKYPYDGMVHLRLGETYQALKDTENAIKEVKLAKSLLPMPQWKNYADVVLKELGGIDEPLEKKVQQTPVEYPGYNGFPFEVRNKTELKDMNDDEVIF